MKNTVGKGAIILTASGLVCKLFGGLFRLPLTNIIGIEGIAVFQMVMTIYSFALVCVCGGVTAALSKLVSSARARGDNAAIGAYLKRAVVFSLCVSAVFGTIFFLFSSSIVSLQGSRAGASGYKLLAIMLPLGGLIGVARGVTQGYGNMSPTAVSQIIEQIVKFAFGLVFAYLFKAQGVEGGVFGAILGITVSEVFACLYMGWKLKRQDKFLFGKKDIYKKEFFSSVLPLTFGGVVLPLSHAIEALFAVKLFVSAGLSQVVATSIYGVQTGVVGAILNFPLIISLAVSSSLLPNLSFLAQKGERQEQKKLITKSMHTMWFLLVPLVVGVMAVAGRVYPIIYPSAMKNYLVVAVQLTFVGGISTVMSAIMQQLVSVLQANGYFKDTLIFYILGGLSKIAVLVIVGVIPGVCVFAISVSSIVLAATVSLCAIIKLRDLIDLSLFELLLPLLASAAMYMVVQIILAVCDGLLGLALAVVVAVALYFVLTFPLSSKYFNLLLRGVKKQRD